MASSLQANLPPFVETRPHELDVLIAAGHNQGADCSEAGIYLGHQHGVEMISWDGLHLRHVDVPAHMGDVFRVGVHSSDEECAFWRDVVTYAAERGIRLVQYVSTALYNESTKPAGLTQADWPCVYDSRRARGRGQIGEDFARAEANFAAYRNDPDWESGRRPKLACPSGWPFDRKWAEKLVEKRK